MWFIGIINCTPKSQRAGHQARACQTSLTD